MLNCQRVAANLFSCGFVAPLIFPNNQEKVARTVDCLIKMVACQLGMVQGQVYKYWVSVAMVGSFIPKKDEFVYIEFYRNAMSQIVEAINQSVEAHKI